MTHSDKIEMYLLQQNIIRMEIHVKINEAVK